MAVEQAQAGLRAAEISQSGRAAALGEPAWTRSRWTGRLNPALVRALTTVGVDALVYLAILAFLAANLPYLESWPTAHNDEARELNAFWVASGADPTAAGLDPEF